MFRFVDGRGNSDWGQYVSVMQQHCFTAFRQSMESLIVPILPNCTWCSVLLSDPWHCHKYWVHLVLWSLLKSFGWNQNSALLQCRPEDSTVEALKRRVLLYSLTVLGLCCGQKVFSMLPRGSAAVTFRKNSRSLEVDGCSVSLDLFNSSSSQSKAILSGGVQNSQPCTVRHWMSSRWHIWALHCPPFLPGSPFLNRRHHREVAACKVICQLPPYHGQCKQHWTSFAFHPGIQLWWTECAAHFQSQALSLVTYCKTKVLEVHSFYQWG